MLKPNRRNRINTSKRSKKHNLTIAERKKLKNQLIRVLSDTAIERGFVTFDGKIDKNALHKYMIQKGVENLAKEIGLL